MTARNDVDRIVEIVPLAVAERETDVTLYTSEAGTAYSTLEPERSPMRQAMAFRPATVVARDVAGRVAGAASRPGVAGPVHQDRRPGGGVAGPGGAWRGRCCRPVSRFCARRRSGPMPT